MSYCEQGTFGIYSSQIPESIWCPSSQSSKKEYGNICANVGPHWSPPYAHVPQATANGKDLTRPPAQLRTPRFLPSDSMIVLAPGGLTLARLLALEV